MSTDIDTPAVETTAIALITPPLPAERSAYLSAMIEASKLANVPGFGAHGSIMGAWESVRSNQLWVDPNFPIRFTEAEKAAARKSLVTARGTRKQQTPFHVLYMPNPKAKLPDENLLIIDIDGMLLFEATANSGIDEYYVIVEENQGAYFQVLTRMVAQKSQQHRLGRLEVGQMYLRIQEARLLEQQAREAKGMPSLPPLPAKDQQAAMFGMSESDFKICIMMAESPDEVIQLAIEGKLTEDQLREVASAIPDAQQRIDAARLIAEANTSAGKPVSRSGVRETIKLAKGESSPVLWQESTQQIEIDRLWGHAVPPTQQVIPAPVVIGRALHDIRFILEMQDGLPQEAKTLLKPILALLKKKEIVELIETVDPYHWQEDETHE